MQKPIKTSVITGDIFHSRKVSAGIWLNALQAELKKYGATPEKWEITRGDSFQLEVGDPVEGLRTAIKIKAAIKQIKGIDVRMAIGIGEKDHFSERISECNGTAFAFSGRKFDTLKKEKVNLAVSSNEKSENDFDRDINLLIRLGLIAMNRWTTRSAEIVLLKLENPDKSQEEIGKLLKTKLKQNAVSGRLKRAFYDEISVILKFFETQIRNLP